MVGRFKATEPDTKPLDGGDGDVLMLPYFTLAVDP